MKQFVKRIIVIFFDLFPWAYRYFEKLIAPEIRWPESSLMKRIQENRELDKFFIRFFLRDPPRKPPNKKNIIVSPADGVLKNIIHLEQKKIIILTMRFHDVHVNRIPISGMVLRVESRGHKIKEGSKQEQKYFRNSWLYDKDYKFPVQKITTLDTEIGEVVLRQVTTVWVRRILTYVHPEENVEIGQKLGMILFGSIVVVELPLQVVIDEDAFFELDKNGERKKRILIAGETVIAKY